MSEPPRFVIRQCTRSTCQFRFPVEASYQRARSCPKCGAAAEIVTEIGPSYIPSEPQSTPEAPPMEALLDNIRSTFNVGAMFRTADGSGFRHLHLCGITPTPDHPKIGKTALGAEGFLPWSYYPNSLNAARELKVRGYQLWALEAHPNACGLFEAVQSLPEQPLVLISGNENVGVDPDLLALCDQIIWIPMHGRKESLNVAVAFSIAAYALRFCGKITPAGNSLK